MADPLTATIGWSTKADPTQAADEAVWRAQDALAGRKPSLALAFGSSWFEQDRLLQAIVASLPNVPVIGASTAGEILPDGPITHSCAIALLASKTLRFGIGVGEELDRHPREAGQRAAFAATKELHDGQRAGFLFFGDGLSANYGEVMRGFQEALGTNARVFGGMAGDDFRFAETYQYANHRVLTRSIVGVLLGGSVRIGLGIEHGFAPISKPRRITRSAGNVLLTLDHQPAASVYEEYFGRDVVERIRRDGLSRQTIAYPLGMQREGTSHWLLRNVLAFGDNGSLQCSGEWIEGSWLQLMIGSRELALEAAHRAAQEAIRSLNRVGCVLVFDSAVRRMLLGPQHAAREIAQIRDVVGASTPLIGCYTYGEQAPVGSSSTYDEQRAAQTGSVLVAALGD